MSDGKTYAPQYLRRQNDPILHGIADMIEEQVEKMKKMRAALADFRFILEGSQAREG